MALASLDETIDAMDVKKIPFKIFLNFVFIAVVNNGYLMLQIYII